VTETLVTLTPVAGVIPDTAGGSAAAGTTTRTIIRISSIKSGILRDGVYPNEQGYFHPGQWRGNSVIVLKVSLFVKSNIYCHDSGQFLAGFLIPGIGTGIKEYRTIPSRKTFLKALR